MLTKGNTLKCQLADKLMNTLSSADSLNLEHFICPVSLCLTVSGSRQSQFSDLVIKNVNGNVQV